MPLGRIDFANAPSYEAIPAGVYEGQTDTWEAKPSSKGDSTNIEARFRFDYTDENGNIQNRSITKWWNLKKEALWRLRADLINMGVDPSEFNEQTDIEALLNQVFGAIPTPVQLTIDKAPYTPPTGGESQLRNNVIAVKLVS